MSTTDERDAYRAAYRARFGVEPDEEMMEAYLTGAAQYKNALQAMATGEPMSTTPDTPRTVRVRCTCGFVGSRLELAKEYAFPAGHIGPWLRLVCPRCRRADYLEPVRISPSPPPPLSKAR